HPVRDPGAVTPPLTPAQTVGPFLSLGLAWPDGPYAVDPGAPGAVCIGGRLLDGNGDGVGDGLIETWQADPDGRFSRSSGARAEPAALGPRSPARAPTRAPPPSSAGPAPEPAPAAAPSAPRSPRGPAPAPVPPAPPLRPMLDTEAPLARAEARAGLIPAAHA